MQITNAIKVAVPTIPAKAVAVIRKETGLPISEIRQRVQAGDFIIEGKLSDDRALLSMVRLSEHLTALGVETTLYQGGMPRSLDFMRNKELDAKYPGTRNYVSVAHVLQSMPPIVGQTRLSPERHNIEK